MGEASNEIERTNGQAVGPHRGTRRTITLGTAGAVALVAAVMLFSPVASAASGGSATTLTAPYSGTSSAAEFWSSSGCGGTLTLSQLPDFDAASGAFTGVVSAASAACGKSTSSMFGEETGSFGTNSFSVAKNGTHLVAASWTIGYAIDITHFARSNGAAGSSVVVGSWAELDDLTNGSSWTVGEGSWSSGTTTHGAWVNYSMSQRYGGTYHLVAGHLYEVVTGVYLEVDAWSSWNGHARSMAAVNMGAAPSDAVLTSMIVA